MNAYDIALAKRVDTGEITPTELVEQILDDHLPEDTPVDTLDLARLIISSLDY
jgi:hypothetical protein